jgi:serine/threonine protein kinase
MNADEWRKINEIFGQARDLPGPEQRGFVGAKAGDGELAQRIFAMLSSDRHTSFLDAGAIPIADELLDNTLRHSFGPYIPKRSLGQGGMGVVYLAEHKEWHTPVAIKVPRDSWVSPDRLERFVAEQRLLARLTHTAIARIYEAGTGPNGTPWFAMEYVEGDPITTFARSRNLTVEQRLELFHQACEAVQYAHSQAIVHRDIKPSNVLVTEQGKAKLLDFGIAKQIENANSNTTKTGAQMLTLAYAAPEQISENRISVHSDIYSLGVTLYELLTNRLPFDLNGLTPPQAHHIISTRVPDKPSLISPLSLNRNEWADLDVLIQKSIHKDVEQRYRSVDALIRDVDHFLKHEPLEARPDSTAYRTRKLIERRRFAVAAAAGTFLLILSLVSYFTWHLAKARDEALAQAKRARQIQLFMTDLFEGGDQVNGPSKDLRVIDLLGTGVEKARQFDNDPLVQGGLYTTLGTIYQSMGEFDKAGSLLQLGLKRLTTATGANSKEVSEAEMYLGKLEDDRGNYGAAEVLTRKALSVARALKPPDPAAVALNELLLASTLLKGKNSYLDALSLLKNAESIQSTLPGVHDGILDNFNLQSIANLHLHRYAEAERLTKFLVDSDRKRHPVLLPDDAEDIMILGEIQEAQLHFDAAEQSFREALHINTASSPNGRTEIAETQRLLAHALMKQGKMAEATPLARQAFLDLDRNYSGLHRRVAYALRVLGQLAQARHDWQEAHNDFTREIAIYRKINNNADLPIALSNAGDVDMELRDYPSAESLFQEAVQKFPTTEWAGGPEAIHAEAKLRELRGDPSSSLKRY